MRTNQPKAPKRRFGSLGFGLFMIALPACHGAGPWYRNQPDGSSNVVYRPVATSLRGRPFYVSGYGGADYSPGRPRRIAPSASLPATVVPDPAVNPTGVTVSQGTWDER